MTVAGGSVQRKRRVQTRKSPRAPDLLAWYDRHRRQLPWRAGPGETPDPYRVWLSEIMLQQTTVTTVAPYFARFVARWPDIASLARAPLEEVLRMWAGLGYYARARNLHACAVAVMERHGGHFPQSEQALAALPGIGRYTAAAIAAIAFDVGTVPVDGNVERVVARLFAVEEELPGAKARIWRLAQALAPARRAGDFAQALMDLGATICTPRRPACALCPWRPGCAAHERGDPDRFPIKPRRRPGRLRHGAAFVLVRTDGFVLVRSRPPGGLLGGMTEVPTSPWTHDFDKRAALSEAPRVPGTRLKWCRIAASVTHVFTHFPLKLAVFYAKAPPGTIAPEGARWVALAEIAGEALPSLMRKVLAHALGRCQGRRRARP
ncbi:MAG TPA: A/G-specific adenine glycosylase [Xanthobacteraceae bacterium]|jgi:A/G-specific adenine glycosylase